MADVTYLVPADGSPLPVRPPFDVRSITIVNDSNQTVRVAFDAGDSIAAEPGTIKAVPARPSLQFVISMDQAGQGYASVLLSDVTRLGVFGTPNVRPDGVVLGIPSGANQAVQFTLPKAVSRLMLQDVGYLGRLTLSATVNDSGVNVATTILSTLFSGFISIALPFLIDASYPAGTVLTLTGNSVTGAGPIGNVWLGWVA